MTAHEYSTGLPLCIVEHCIVLAGGKIQITHRAVLLWTFNTRRCTELTMDVRRRAWTL